MTIKHSIALADRRTRMFSGTYKIELFSDNALNTLDSVHAGSGVEKLIVYDGVFLEYDDTGYLRIGSLSSVAANALGLLSGTAKWFRMVMTLDRRNNNPYVYEYFLTNATSSTLLQISPDGSKRRLFAKQFIRAASYSRC